MKKILSALAIVVLIVINAFIFGNQGENPTTSSQQKPTKPSSNYSNF